ncbi:BlaI/MecI/CopY family transcriptional regulator [Streptomyces sp. PT12]|uniref:BlaI/MecI/CopY family transcriptional regulator n=1 Tax=Streptomyces sp. PT12 TaxID=1510197 RepID=UPI000DE4760C|nr:BlaI/MecI/CopY family transcriptional regulator [Streptomyces sp. PT12]RBM06846.1 CopY family transcriptional regulator [Streptomyces sp. PT12]
MRPLGELEAEVMNVVWHRAGPVTAQDLTDALNERRPLAYTTVMTVVDRLRAKGWLTREKAGRAFRYTAARSGRARVQSVGAVKRRTSVTPLTLRAPQTSPGATCGLRACLCALSRG